MAQARKSYLIYLRNKPDIKKFPYVVIADFNLLNNKITAKGVLTSWIRNDWDVVTANQSGKYYDIWALRHNLWSPNDCWRHHAFLREYLKFPELAITYAIRSRMLKIPKNSGWIKVQSSFGGLGIYKTETLMKENFYKGTDTEGNIICEHVPFHEYLSNEGSKIFINPGMINTRYTDHSRRITLLPTIIRITSFTKIFRNKFRRKSSSI
jgi:TfoX/Sxy family transcriptional regulator of competence genes